MRMGLRVGKAKRNLFGELVAAWYRRPLASGGAGKSKDKSNFSALYDFDDLLLWTERLLREPALQQIYGQRFKFILVDEYQDTNRLQGDVVDLLARFPAQPRDTGGDRLVEDARKAYDDLDLEASAAKWSEALQFFASHRIKGHANGGHFLDEFWILHRGVKSPPQGVEDVWLRRWRSRE